MGIVEKLDADRVGPKPRVRRDSTAPAEHRPAIRTVEIILKVAERCNLVCSYCYYFFAGDQSYRSRPPRISSEVVERLASFLADGVRDLDLPSVKIVFHGGEPLLLRKADFEQACEILRASLQRATSLELSVQTNGVLLDAEWIEIFRRQGVTVGISIDGDQEINDRFRVDRRGRGSHSRIVEGIRLLKDAAIDSPWLEPGLLTVLNAGNDIARIYRHFVDELGAKSVATLLPDCSRDDGIPNGRTAEEYGKILCDLFDMWVANTEVKQREMHRLLAHFQKSKKGIWQGRRNPVVVVQSDGALSMDDSYVPAQAWRERMPAGSIFADTLADWLWSEAYCELDGHYERLPGGCTECVWRNVCRGGDLENRYSRERSFDNPSIFCEGLKLFYLHVTRHLARNGYPVDEIFARLEI